MSNNVSSTNLTSLYGSSGNAVSVAVSNVPPVDNTVASKNLTTLYSAQGQPTIIPSSNTGGTANIIILDEGILITPNVASMNFVGASVVASAIGNAVTINISGSTSWANITDKTGANGPASISVGQFAADPPPYSAVFFGGFAGNSTSGTRTVAIGESSGQGGQLANSVAVGFRSGRNSQGFQAVAIGNSAGQGSQGNSSVAIGALAGNTNQANNSIILNATGSDLDQTTANTFTVKPVRNANTANVMFYNTTSGEITYDLIGTVANANYANFAGNAFSVNVANVVGIGNIAVLNLDGNSSNILYGNGVFATVPNTASANFANFAGNLINGNSNVNTNGSGGNISISVGGNANVVVIDSTTLIAGNLIVNSNSVRIGSNAGSNAQYPNSVAIGSNAGSNTQGVVFGGYSIAIGDNAGSNSQGGFSVAIGNSAASNSQGVQSIAIGKESARNDQGIYSIAIGPGAGYNTQGNYAIAIGKDAGFGSQANNSIVLNATGTTLNQTTANTFTVKPVRNANTANIMFYDNTTGEITYDLAVTPNSVANANYANFAGNVTNSAQPNITSVGNLPYLQVSNSANADGVITQLGSNNISITTNFSNVATYQLTTLFHPNNSTGYPSEKVIRSRGNVTTPTTASSGDRIYQKVGYVYNGTTNVFAVAQTYTAVGTVNANANAVWTGGQYNLVTANPVGNLGNADATSAQNQLQFSNSGTLLINPGTAPNTSLGQSTSSIIVTSWGQSTANLVQVGGINFQRARGNRDTVLNVQANDQIGRNVFYGYSANAYQTTNVSQYRAVVDSTYVDNDVIIPMNHQIQTVANVAGVATFRTTSFNANGLTSFPGDITTTGTANLGALNVTGTSNLGAVGNVIITGGVANYVLSTNGSGNLSWVAQTVGGSSNISNGTSNVDIATANGNVTVSVAGNANVAVFTGTTAIVGNLTVNSSNITLGSGAGATAQGFDAVAIGDGAGASSQGAFSIAIGKLSNSGPSSVAVGTYSNAALGSVSIGREAGNTGQGQNSVAIGYFAGNLNQATNSIILNATGAALNQTTANTFTVKPVRNANTSNVLYYNNTTGEITYDISAGGSSSSISNGTSNVNIATANGNVTVGVGGTSNVLIVTTTGANITGTANISGNANVGNLGTGGLIVATGNITGGNLVTSGALSVTGNANVGNLGTGGLIVATGNITGGNLVTSGVLSVTGNANVGNLGTGGLIVATGNITGGNLVTSGVLSVTGNANVGNIGSNIAIITTGNITTGNVANLFLTKYQETVGSSANTSTSISPNIAASTIFNYTANANFTFNGLTSAVAGSSATVIITQDATGNRLMTSTMLFVGGSKTLSTAASAKDIVSVFYDGTTYFASLTKAYS